MLTPRANYYDWSTCTYIRIRIWIHLLARRNLLWDILRFSTSRRAALDLYVILMLWRARGANQQPYALLHRSSPCCTMTWRVVVQTRTLRTQNWEMSSLIMNHDILTMIHSCTVKPVPKTICATRPPFQNPQAHFSLQFTCVKRLPFQTICIVCCITQLNCTTDDHKHYVFLKIQFSIFLATVRTYFWGPPSRCVLWWMSFHVAPLSLPVVVDFPMVKTRRCSNALFSKPRTTWPSLLLGKNACLYVPLYHLPGFGWLA